MRRIRPSYANVMSTVAVFIALGGTSYAAVKLSAKSVGERELKEGAVTGAKVKDGTIGPADLAPGAAGSGPRGPRGAEGPAGPNGAPGATGANGATKVVVRRRDDRVYDEFGSTAWRDVLSLPIPSAGKWLVRSEVQIGYFPDSPSAAWFDCRFVFGGVAEPEGRQKGAHLGNTAGAQLLDIQPHTAAFTATGPTTVVLSCHHTATLPTSAVRPFYERAVISATQADVLDYAEVN